MGRVAKYNWKKLFLEYNQGRYKNMAEFAKAKGINYDSIKKEFKKLKAQSEDENGGKKEIKKRGKKGQKNEVKNTPPKEKGQKIHPWETLKKQFLDWPDDKLEAYLTQIEARLDELNVVPYEELDPDEKKELGKLRRERRAILSDPDPSKICKAVRNGKKCNNPVERGKEVCWNHGGAPGSGAPKGNKNGLKHGAYETIWLDQLDEEEQELAERVTQDKVKALEEEIQLLTIRERRMMKRIAELSGQDFTVVKRKYEKGFGPMGPVDKDDIEEYATLGQIQTIEEHLTKVQDKKTRLLVLLHQIEKDREELELKRQRLELDKRKVMGDDDTTEDDGFIDALKEDTEEVWSDADGED